MQTIEQVSKRLSTDPNWFSKCMLGVVLSIIPIAHFVAYGYLFRLFRQGRERSEIALPEWTDWKELFIDGLICFLVLLIFAFLPVALMMTLVSFFTWDTFLTNVLLAPVYFLAGPVGCAALYLYVLSGNLGGIFNVDALIGLLKKGLPNYWVLTLAYLGLVLMLPFAYFAGGVIYFYLMGQVFKNLERRADNS